jgi:DNA-directed RNA polymerase sigma subunit (sigma70/sigma32)
LDVNRSKKTLNIPFKDRDLDELPETCSLDVADNGPHTLEEIGDLLNVSRERIRQIIDGALNRLYLEFPDVMEEFLED